MTHTYISRAIIVAFAITITVVAPVAGSGQYHTAQPLGSTQTGVTSAITNDQLAGDIPNPLRYFGRENESSISSTFESGTDGWTVAGDAQGEKTNPTYQGGHISADDNEAGETWYWHAPSKFLGDKSAFYGGMLSFELKQSDTSRQFDQDDVILVGGGHRLVYDLPASPGTEWTSYEVPLEETAAWTAEDGDQPTQAEMEEALSTLSTLRIRGEYRTGEDTGAIDSVTMVSGANVEATPTPEPTPTATDTPVATPTLTDVGVDMNSNSRAVTPGKSVTYVVDVANKGEDPTQVDLEFGETESGGTEVSQTNNLTVVSLEPSQGECDENGCDLGTLSGGSMERVALKLKAEKPGEVEYTAVARTDRPDANPRDNSDSVKTTVAESLITGQVTVNAPRGGTRRLIQPMKRVKVKLYVDGSEVAETFTDDDGYYVFEDVSGEKYQLEISLVDEDIMVLVTDPINSAKTKEAEINDEKIVDNVELSNRKKSDLDLAVWKKRKVMDEAVFYYYALQAADYSHENFVKLKEDSIEFTRTALVDFDFSKGGQKGGTRYEEGKIYVGYKQSRSSRPGVPDNRAYHEFGHHVHAHSRMSASEAPGLTRLPTRPEGDENHGGVENSNSQDSYTEGFANFYSALVRDDQIYRSDTGALDLQRNFHTRHGKPDEEFNVAALLWDLQDDDEEDGDYFSMPVDHLWEILNHEDVTTVRSLYQRLKRSEGPDGAPLNRRDTNENDELTDLQRLFVIHGFYDDLDDDGTWDNAGDRGGMFPEPVGYAHRWDNQTRKNYPAIPGSYVEYSVVDLEERELNASFRVNVDFASEKQRYEYSYTARPASGNVLGLRVPHDSSRVTVTPVVPGYRGDPLVLTYDDYLKNLGEAQENNESSFMSHRFEMKRNDVTSPGNLDVERIDDLRIRLQWESPKSADGVILVKGVGYVPSSPEDGEVVFEGKGDSYTDVLTFRGYDYYYALFSVSDNELSSGIHTEAISASADSRDKNNGSTALTESDMPKENPPIFVFGILVFVVALFISTLYYWRYSARKSEEG